MKAERKWQHRHLSLSHPPTQPLGRQLCEKLNLVSLSGGCKTAGIVAVRERKKTNSRGGEGGKIEGGNGRVGWR